MGEKEVKGGSLDWIKNNILTLMILLGIVLYGFNQGWFQPKVNITQEPSPESASPQEVAPTPSSPVLTTCSQVCSQQGSFTNNYAALTCNAGETKVTYSYPGQPPLLQCCCYNVASTCVDTDGGKDIHVKGSAGGPTDCCTTVNGGVCLGSGTSDYVAEQYCDASTDTAKMEVIQCPSGEKCVAGLQICVPESQFTCSETDIGWLDKDQPDFKGACTDVSGTKNDGCNDGTHTTEYSCENNFCVFKSASDCGGGSECIDGDCFDIPGSEVTTNPNSDCYGRTNFIGDCYLFVPGGFGTCSKPFPTTQAECENSYQHWNGIWYSGEWGEWGNPRCDSIGICGRD